MRKKLVSLFVGILSLLVSGAALAQVPVAGGEQPISKPILILFLLLVLSLSPFILMMTTSFVKIAVVLSLVRQAMGTQQIPPNQIVTGLALILTVYVMIPVGQDVYQKTSDIIHQTETSEDVLSSASVNMLKKALDAGKEPVRSFLLKHIHDQERKLFYGLGRKSGMDKAEGGFSDKDFIVLIPGFVISELSEAFQIGFVIFLPFLVLDMVVSNILLSMGMFQLSPITVSLPFKLLLFVLVDGWYLITKGLVAGYMN